MSRHRIQSGVLTFTLSLTPTSSSGGANAVSINVEGPFENRGNQRPALNFNISVSNENRTTSLSVISTGGAGYVTADGASYELPASSVQKLESSLFPAGSSGAAAGSGSANRATTASRSTSATESTTATGSTTAIDLSELGIHPQDWLVNPRVVGSDRVGGVATTRIHAGVDATKLVADLSALLSKTSSLGLSSSVGELPGHLSATTQRQIAAEIRDPSVDVWTGTADRILRKLNLSLEVPAAPAAGKAGSGSVGIALSLQYSDLNRPQTILPPVSAKPYTAFQAKLQTLAQQLGVAGTQKTVATARTHKIAPKHRAKAKPQPPELTLSPYAQCISNAEGNVQKMQGCASLSNGTSKSPHSRH